MKSYIVAIGLRKYLQHRLLLRGNRHRDARLLGGIRMITRTRDYPALADRFKVSRRDDLAAFYAGLDSRAR